MFIKKLLLSTSIEFYDVLKTTKKKKLKNIKIKTQFMLNVKILLFFIYFIKFFLNEKTFKIFLG